MKVVITDANIFMHLIDSGLPESFFRLDFEIATTEEVFAEIGDERHLLAPFAGGRLEIISSQDDQLATIQSAAFAPGLSFPDRTVLFHATLRNGTVLTGESLMRKNASDLVWMSMVSCGCSIAWKQRVLAIAPPWQKS